MTYGSCVPNVPRGEKAREFSRYIIIGYFKLSSLVRRSWVSKLLSPLALLVPMIFIFLDLAF